MSGETYCPITQLYTVFEGLEDHLISSEKSDNLNYFHDGIIDMQEKLEEYWPNLKKLATICMTLDPRFKLDFVDGKASKKEAKSDFIKIYKAYDAKFREGLLSETQVENEPVKQKTLSMAERMLLGIKSKVSSFQKDEFDIYLNEPRIVFSNKFDVVEWWRNKQERFPILSSIAKDYLCIQITSVPYERSFSISGLTVTKLRNQLNPETVRRLMCLKSWFSI